MHSCGCVGVKWLTGAVEHGEAEKGEIYAMGLGCDVASEESVKATFQKIEDEYGRIDVGRAVDERKRAELTLGA